MVTTERIRNQKCYALKDLAALTTRSDSYLIHYKNIYVTLYREIDVKLKLKRKVDTYYKNLAEEEDGNTEITGTMALLGGFLTLTR